MKYAVVTGSTKGIGKAIAVKLLSEGYYVFINYSSDDDAAQQFREEITEYNSQYTITKQRLSSYEDAEQYASFIRSVAPHIDCLILNTAVTDRTVFGEITKESWEFVLNTNLNVPFYLLQKLQDGICNNSGRIIFIGSIMGKYPHAMSLSYAVSKAALHQLAHNLVKEFAPRKITVNALLPGFTDTSWQVNKSNEQRQRIESKIALHRFGQSDEIADMCWCVINNQYINGAEISIDGGYCFE